MSAGRKCLSYSAAQARYGRIDLAVPSWPQEARWMGMIAVPDPVARRWINAVTGRPTVRIYANRDMHAALRQAWCNLQDRDCLGELKTFDGCFCLRAVRGLDRVSTHSYGLAIDLNAKENPLRAQPRLSPEFVACWTDAGFDWGGAWHRRRDGMHFSYAWEGAG